MNKQELFWQDTYAQEYIARNSTFDLASGIKAWAEMTKRMEPIKSILECGSNIGRNINSLNHLMPDATKSIIEISPAAFKVVTDAYCLEEAYNCSIVDADFGSKQFDLVFTTGVLIHIAPNALLKNLTKVYGLSRKYILFCEMFSRLPKSMPYRGENDLLFTRDYGRYFLEHFECHVVDYGFLWGHYYDDAGFDDGHYWVFEKPAA